MRCRRNSDLRRGRKRKASSALDLAGPTDVGLLVIAEAGAQEMSVLKSAAGAIGHSKRLSRNKHRYRDRNSQKGFHRLASSISAKIVPGSARLRCDLGNGLDCGRFDRIRPLPAQASEIHQTTVGFVASVSDVTARLAGPPTMGSLRCVFPSRSFLLTRGRPPRRPSFWPARLSARSLAVTERPSAARSKSLLLSRHGPDRAEELSRIASTIGVGINGGVQ